MSLWGPEFDIQPKVNKTKILNKIAKPQKVVKSPESSTKKLKKSGTTIADQYDAIPGIEAEVFRILGKYKQNTSVITDLDTFIDYIDIAIKNRSIAVDTETNNSIDPITCKLMGLCIYTPGMNQAYIPVNHVDKEGHRLAAQITESQICEQLKRLSDITVIMHNGKFDYQVLKCTCGVELEPQWDTMVAARILDENELRASLKEQYIDKIDSSQERYSIEHLFEHVSYEILDPDLFALYAATDSKMTYELYLWQLNKFSAPENKKLFELFLNVEMPVVKVAAEMELTGVCIDLEYSKRLSAKYHNKINQVDAQINEELIKYKDIICQWRSTPEANIHPASSKSNKDGSVRYMKSKNEQLQDPVSITSPTQLAILLYDVLKVPIIDRKNPRGTGEEIIEKIDLPICSLILQKRGLEKLIGTYIDKLPQCINAKDNRLHASFNQVGARTGRFSSSDPNLQNIPSHNKEIRLMFTAGYTEYNIDSSDNSFEINKNDELKTIKGFVVADNITEDDFIYDAENRVYLKVLYIQKHVDTVKISLNASQEYTEDNLLEEGD